MAVIDDQDIRERAGRDLRQSFIVDAGAGTGKTTVLISRILGAIASGKSSLDKIVAITFTEKAADLSLCLALPAPEPRGFSLGPTGGEGDGFSCSLGMEMVGFFSPFYFSFFPIRIGPVPL